MQDNENYRKAPNMLETLETINKKINPKYFRLKLTKTVNKQKVTLIFFLDGMRVQCGPLPP